MSFDAKALKEIAKACRAAGISHYKCAEFEFTLTPEAPVSNYKKKQQVVTGGSDAIDPNFTSDSLTDEQLLLWSSAEIAPGETGSQ